MLGAIRFHAANGKIFAYELDQLPNLDSNLILQSPGVEPVFLQDLVLTAIGKDKPDKTLVEWAVEDFHKLVISGDEKTIAVPISVFAIPEVPFIVHLNGFLVQINQVEVVSHFIFQVAPFKDVQAKSYQNESGESSAHILSAQIGKLKTEIIKSVSSEKIDFYVIDSAGKIQKIN